jgi:hypothetical protein
MFNIGDVGTQWKGQGSVILLTGVINYLPVLKSLEVLVYMINNAIIPLNYDNYHFIEVTKCNDKEINNWLDK